MGSGVLLNLEVGPFVLFGLFGVLYLGCALVSPSWCRDGATPLHIFAGILVVGTGYVGALVGVLFSID